VSGWGDPVEENYSRISIQDKELEGYGFFDSCQGDSGGPIWTTDNYDEVKMRINERV